MSLRTAQYQLKHASQVLCEKWEALQGVWKDEASRTFERDVIAPLDPAVRNAMSAMSRVDELLRRARSETE